MMWLAWWTGCSSVVQQYQTELHQVSMPEADEVVELSEDVAMAEEEGEPPLAGGMPQESADRLAVVMKARNETGVARYGPRPEPAPPPSDEAASVRQWFPEAFLWQPRVVTNEQGMATLEVRVPDQLTSWRVLALAHDSPWGASGHHPYVRHSAAGVRGAGGPGLAHGR